MKTLSPPHSVEAEQSILGGILLEPDVFDRVADSIRSSDFYIPAHQTLFDMMINIQKNKRPADLLNVSNLLTEQNLLEGIGGAPYLMSLLDAAIGSTRVDSYCEILKQKSIQRGLITSCRDIQHRSFANKFSSIDELLEFAMKEMQNIESQRTSKETLVDIMSVMKEVIPDIERRSKNPGSLVGLSTGFKEIDFLTQGLKPSELVIVAARPSMGKTALSMNLAYNMAVTLGKKVAYFSIEMPKETLVLRMLASACKIDLVRLQAGQIRDSEWSTLIDRAGRIAQAEFYIDDSNPLSPSELRARCRYLKMTKGIDCVMVDYLQMMRLKGGRAESREREVAEVSSTLKAIAKEFKIPVLALAQLNREADRREGNRPVISDLRDSGSIEMDADLIMMLYREDYYQKDDPSVAGNTEIIIGKNRNGRTGTAKLRFIAEHNRFEDRI
jgi:replicative DNA helicase